MKKIALPIMPPKTEKILLQRCYQLSGMTFSSLSSMVNLKIPEQPLQRKGWLGMVLEQLLGTSAQNHARPDFPDLGIELKTIPLSHTGKPAESTFITSIPLLTLHRQTWETSNCLAKLRRVLWIPVEADPDIPFKHRRIGQGFLWSPDPGEMQILRSDWIYLSGMICTGELELLQASHGEYLQVRPKAADGRSLCFGLNAQGKKVPTIPRGFYLRSSFTAKLNAMPQLD